jgi:nitrate reductase NapAB chaperone NapD
MPTAEQTGPVPGSGSKDAEVHIAGIVVYANPASIEVVAACISELACATVYVKTPDGKIVVTLETDSTRRTLDYMDAIRFTSMRSRRPRLKRR